MLPKYTTRSSDLYSNYKALLEHSTTKLHVVRALCLKVPLHQCALGKNTKGTFQNSNSKTKNVLEFVHSNLFGPMSVPSMGGFLYYVVFVDDFSRKTWIYFLKCKESEEII